MVAYFVSEYIPNKLSKKTKGSTNCLWFKIFSFCNRGTQLSGGHLPWAFKMIMWKSDYLFTHYYLLTILIYKLCMIDCIINNWNKVSKMAKIGADKQEPHQIFSCRQ